jgi:hypothetical protein
MNDESSRLVIELVKEFIAVMQNINQNWEKGYLRFMFDVDYYQSSRSYATANDIFIVDAIKYRGFFDQIDLKGRQIFDALGRSKGLFLLVVDSDFNYDIKFEWSNLDRWRITKLDGGTGVPLGL